VLTILPRGNWTPLMYAAREGAVAATRALAEAGADVNLTDPEQTTALLRAIVNVHYDVAGELLERGADPNITDTSNMGALYAVAEMETIGEIYGRPARRFTDTLDGVALVKRLLAHGAKANAQLRAPTIQKNHTPGDGTLGNGATPLMRAAKGGDHRIMQALLDAGADPTIRTSAGAPALIIAAGLTRRRRVPEGLGTEDDMSSPRADRNNVTNVRGQTALHFAVRTRRDGQTAGRKGRHLTSRIVGSDAARLPRVGVRGSGRDWFRSVQHSGSRIQIIGEQGKPVADPQSQLTR
jgi:ankyrin repeat protein